jgi:DNA recombination protein RmuC
MSTLEFIVLAVALLAVLGLQVVLLSRARRGGDERHAFERLERELRQELQTSAQATRQELAAHLAQNQAATVQQLDGMRQQIQLNSQGGREEQARALKRFSDTLNGALANLTESNAQRMLESVRRSKTRSATCRATTPSASKRCARPSTKSCTRPWRRA